jgi:heme o synthase
MNTSEIKFKLTDSMQATGGTPMAAGVVRSYISLTKPRIVLMVLITTLIGYLMGSRGFINLGSLFHLVVWSTFSCAGVGVLNQYIERKEDAKMLRTRKRALPTNAVMPTSALVFGLVLTLAGSVSLWVFLNPLCGLLSGLTVLLYLAVYTPLKKLSWWNTIVGAIPGALPPVGGWAAATGSLEWGSVVLFLILFCWQHPHFYSIAWMYKEDYERGGFKMLPSVDTSGKSLFFQIFLFLGLLLISSLLPLFFATTTHLYTIVAVGLALMFLLASIKFYREQDKESARSVLRASIIYLPGILLAMVLQVKY